MKTIPILLTSSVTPHDDGVALKDVQERIRLALQSVQEWLRVAPGHPIVLCDGSNHDFSVAVREQFPDAPIECLAFENRQDMVRQFGRGYGEGEIVRHALSRSKFISEAGCFAKCSSKLWVENFSECVKNWRGGLRFKAVFLDVFSPVKATRLAYIDTRFYLASCRDYQAHFIDAHLAIRKDDGHGLEECFRDIFLQQGFKASLFDVPPIICGVGGGTGVYYKNPLKRRLKERLRLLLVRKSREFSQYF